MPTKIVDISPGLRQVLSAYCKYRKWESVSPKTAKDIRLLINRAGSIEETLQGLKWFFEGKLCDSWIESERPNLGLPFLTQNWERFEIDVAERSKYAYIYDTKFNEYAIMRSI